MNGYEKAENEKRPCKISLAGSIFYCGLIFGFTQNQILLFSYLLEIAACAAARRAIGTRKGEQDT